MNNRVINQESSLNKDFQFLKVLIDRCKNNDQEACAMLLKYFKSVVNKCISRGIKELGETYMDDIKSVAYCGIYTATLDFNGDNSLQYFYFVNKRIVSRVNDYIIKEKRHLRPGGIDHQHYYIQEDIADDFNLENNCIHHMILEEAYFILNNNERNLYTMIFIKKMSHKEVSNHLEISNECLRQRKTRLVNKIRNVLRRKGLFLNFDIS